jgi:uncharacterized repeat protein (TIGR01451 family)
MKHLTSLNLRQRFLAVAVAAVVCTLTLVAATALSDAGNPILGTISATSVDNGDGTVTIFVRGQWNWLSHHSDCNVDRAGAGVGIIWNDPTEPGYTVAKGSVSAQVGISALRAGDSVNKLDQMVHPSDLGNVAEGYPGPTGQTFNDPSPPTTGAFATWKGGCGREPLTATASPGSISAVNPSGQSCADGTTNCSTHPWGSWGYAVNGGKGYSHTYLANALPSKVCVNFYDVHGKSQVVNGAKEITVDANGDNSIQTNSFNVNNGANCISVALSTISTTASNAPTVDTPIHDTATLTTPAGAGGTITFKAFGPRALNSTTPDCSGTAAFSPAAVTVNGSGTYTSPSFTATKAGLYDWTATYSGDPSNSVLGATSSCGALNETSTVNLAAPAVTTDASPLTVVAGVGTGTADLSDKATLSGATSGATGTITFKLFSDVTCQTQVAGSTRTVTVNGNGTYTSTPVVTVPPGQYNWIANYSGDLNNSPTVNGCGGTNENPKVVPAGSSIDVTKSTSTPFVISGGTATFGITVTNTGDATLTGVNVTDAQASGCARTAAQIAADRGSSTFVKGATYTYNCTLANVTTNITNSATGCGTPPAGSDVCDTGTTIVTVIHPHISVLKTTTTPTILSGSTALFTIKVTNDGDATLTNVHVTDAQAPGCAKTSADIPALTSMAPSTSLSYDCSLANVTSNLTNTAAAIGTPPAGPDVEASSSADVVVIHPHIAITKSTTTPTITSGQTASFGITVKNDGDVTLSNVRVTDSQAPGCAKTSSDIAGLASMAPNATVTYNCTLANVTASLTNIAVATGTPPIGPDVIAFDSADVTVIGPAITIEKTTSTPVINSGATATFTIKVTNSGNATLTDVAVTDAQAPGCARTKAQVAGLASIAAGASVSYDCTLANVTSTITNFATACGNPPVGSQVCDTDTTTVTVTTHPHISVVKTTSTPTVTSGGTATFTIKVTNDGDVTLTNVHVDDTQAPGCARTSAQISALASMAPNASVSYDCTLANLAASIVNTAVATGTPPAGPDVTGSSSVPVTVPATTTTTTTTTTTSTTTNVITVPSGGGGGGSTTVVVPTTPPAVTTTTTTTTPAPPATIVGLRVAKTQRVTGDFTSVEIATKVGDRIQYHIVVTNSGNTSLKVTLSDPKCDGLAPSGQVTIGAGASQTYSCSHVVTASDPTFIVNTATARGTTPAGRSVGPVSSTVTAKKAAVLAAKKVKKVKPVKKVEPVKKVATKPKPVTKPAQFTG